MQVELRSSLTTHRSHHIRRIWAAVDRLHSCSVGNGRLDGKCGPAKEKRPIGDGLMVTSTIHSSMSSTFKVREASRWLARADNVVDSITIDGRWVAALSGRDQSRPLCPRPQPRDHVGPRPRLWMQPQQLVRQAVVVQSPQPSARAWRRAK